MNSGDEASVVVSVSPNNTTYYAPICSDDIKPYEGQMFATYDEAEAFYKFYSLEVGFTMRRATGTKAKDGTKLWRYLVCNRQGHLGPYKPSIGENSEPKRRRMSNRCGCPAHFIFRQAGRDGFCLKMFEERHNHPLLPPSQRHFAPDNRKLTLFHQDFITNCLKTNIGTSKAYKLFKNYVGSYSNVGATLVDFKNFQRDLNTYMIGCDGQMLIDNLFRRKERCEAFYFDYEVNDQNQLCRLFYSDPISRKSFSFFGDVVSADATYKSNRYDMVFVPFTGVDNNKSSITFGFGLLLKEDIASYVWLFENFKKAMGHEPYILLTDQDAAVKAAIEQVFSNVVHRFCMWHIMFKVPVKVKLDSSLTEDFRRRFNSIVWSNDLRALEFEEAWRSIITDFRLEENVWLQTIFDLRQYWIPAFFQGYHMGGLLRTTSRSESQNSFFSNFIGRSSSLILFLLQFDNAIDAQRHNKRKLDMESCTLVPIYETKMPIEVECASVYTLNVFKDVQEEIIASVYDCRLTDLNTQDDVKYWHVSGTIGPESVVRHSITTQDISCSCNLFMNMGIPCRHMFMVFNNLRIKLPEKYINPRWTKKSSLKPAFEIDGVVFNGSDDLDDKKVLVFELLSEIHCCINMIDDNPEKLKDLLSLIKEKKQVYSREACANTDSPSKRKMSRFETFLGPIPEEIFVLPPPQSKNKGRPKEGRLKSISENVIVGSSKDKRVCSICQKPGHNKKTCKFKPESLPVF